MEGSFLEFSGHPSEASLEAMTPTVVEYAWGDLRPSLLYFYTVPEESVYRLVEKVQQNLADHRQRPPLRDLLFLWVIFSWLQLWIGIHLLQCTIELLVLARCEALPRPYRDLWSKHIPQVVLWKSLPHHCTQTCGVCFLFYTRLLPPSQDVLLAEPCDSSAHHQSIGATNKHVISVKVKHFCALRFKVHQMN